MNTNTECTRAQLKQFSWNHYTWINQIFGDMTVRDIISEVYPNPRYEFAVEDTGAEFGYSHHHTLLGKGKNKGKDFDSTDEKNKYQDMNINENDTLCQSYSLLVYRRMAIHADQKQRQMDMIRMYRQLLHNKEFIRTLKDDVIHAGNAELWRDYACQGCEDGKGPFLPMDIKYIVKHIHDTLDEWERFGYWFFIGKGRCPNEKKSATPPPSSRKRKRSSSPHHFTRRLRQRTIQGSTSPSPQESGVRVTRQRTHR